MAPGTRLLLAAMQEAANLVHVITHHAAISHLHRPLGLLKLDPLLLSLCSQTARSPSCYITLSSVDTCSVGSRGGGRVIWSVSGGHIAIH